MIQKQFNTYVWGIISAINAEIIDSLESSKIEGLERGDIVLNLEEVLGGLLLNLQKEKEAWVIEILN